MLDTSMKLMRIAFKKFCDAKQVQHKSFQLLCTQVGKNAGIPQLEVDTEYLCNIKHKLEIEENIKFRKGVGNITRVHELHDKLLNSSLSVKEKDDVWREFIQEAKQIPNKTCPLVFHYGETPKTIKLTGIKAQFDFKPKEFSEIVKYLHLMRSENLSNLSGHKSYYFMGELAELEHALILYTVEKLLARNFQLISVPDILQNHVIESCGMNIKGDRTQVYMLDDNLYKEDYCLSGTAEMALARYVMNKELCMTKLPLKLAAVSRCYRAETSRTSEERGIYRVHQFTKVEMFGVTENDGSSTLLEELRELQEETFASLGLHFQTLDMPPHELGAPAFRKYDIEAWMPGRQIFGEVSSCSDCTDYQSRRLNIKYCTRTGQLLHAHTVNGTACAVPRMLIALLETHQQADGTVSIPKTLQPYMKGKSSIGIQKNIPEMKFVKSKQREAKTKSYDRD
ncbi:serine--tRNA ligase, mitochondrial [Periplaneta americana]|uniref:serine--tRNA ligase, mitochondrial n=1 Tax=Periplaneta americana TaxID=6978 RepID=UPI0037E8176E